MASTGEVWKLGHRPALDGVRGIAILLVLASHFFPAVASSAGGLGVAMFFALSGYLIASLLLDEQERRGRIDLAGFARRRVRRLVPALVPVVVATVALSVTLHPQFATAGWAVAALAFVSNWHAVSHPVSIGLTHTWSLGVEAQFYLGFPLLLVALQGRRAVLLGVLVVGIVVSLGARVALAATATSARFYYGTDTNLAALLAGAAVAVAAVRWRPHPHVVTGAVVCLLVFALVPVGLWVTALGLIPAAAVAALVVLASDGSEPPWLRSGWLGYVGRRSYGLYLWHLPVMWVGLVLDVPSPWRQALGLLATWAFAELSWRLIESRRHAMRPRDFAIRSRIFFPGQVVETITSSTSPRR